MKKRHALLLANGEYREMRLAHLPLPGEGWEGFAQWLRDPHGGQFQSVDVVSGATQAQTLLSIERFFSNKGKDDTLLLWFGGHAIVDAHGETFLCLRDSDRLRLKSTAVMAGVLAMHMDAAATPEKLLILDCRFHAFASQKQDADMHPVLRPERAFVGRGNAKHILLAEPDLHLHTHIEAESALRAISPFTRALTAIWREQNEELQGLGLSDLYPILCRRLGMAAKPQWHRIGEARDVMLAAAARTEMVAVMNSSDGERGPRDIDHVDWDRLSGEIPLDILGLGLGHAGASSSGSPTSPSGGAGGDVGDGPGNPGDTGGLSSDAGGAGDEGAGRTGDEPPTGEIQVEAQANGSVNDPADARRADPNETGIFMLDGMEPANTARPAPKASPRLHPEDLLDATQSMLSPEAMELMGGTQAGPKENPPPSPSASAAAETLPTVTAPKEPSLEEKMRRALEAEAERERAEAQSQEEEVRKQAEALKRWKEQQALPQPDPAITMLDLSPLDLLPIDLSSPTRTQPAAPSAPVSWMPPEVQQTQMIDAESAEALREAANGSDAAEARRPAPVPKPSFPSHDPAFAATQMYIAEDPTDSQNIPLGLEPTKKPVDGRSTGALSSYDKAYRQAYQDLNQSEAQATDIPKFTGSPESPAAYAGNATVYPGAGYPNPAAHHAQPGQNAEPHHLSYDAPTLAAHAYAASPAYGTTAPAGIAPTTSGAPASQDQGATMAPPTADFAAYPGNYPGAYPGAYPGTLGQEPGRSPLYTPRQENPWLKPVLISSSLILPMVFSGFLLHKSGLWDRLFGRPEAVILPASEVPLEFEPETEPPAAEILEAAPTANQAASGNTPQRKVSAKTAQPLASNAQKAGKPMMPQPVKLPAKAVAPRAAAKPKPAPTAAMLAEDEIIHRNLKVALQNKVEREKMQLAALYERYVLAYPQLQGIVNLRLEVGGDGRIRESKCVSSSTELPAFDKDVARIAAGWRLQGYSSPRPKYVTVPLRFPLPGQTP